MYGFTKLLDGHRSTSWLSIRTKPLLKLLKTNWFKIVSYRGKHRGKCYYTSFSKCLKRRFFRTKCCHWRRMHYRSRSKIVKLHNFQEGINKETCLVEWNHRRMVFNCRKMVPYSRINCYWRRCSNKRRDFCEWMLNLTSQIHRNQSGTERPNFNVNNVKIIKIIYLMMCMYSFRKILK